MYDTDTTGNHQFCVFRFFVPVLCQVTNKKKEKLSFLSTQNFKFIDSVFMQVTIVLLSAKHRRSIHKKIK